MSTIQIGIQCDSVVKPSGYAIGMAAFGGIIGYIYQPGDAGFVLGETHGLIVSSGDLNTGSFYGTNGLSLNSSDGLGAGGQNTTNAINVQGNILVPAICRSHNGGGFNDWFCPSRAELTKIFANRLIIGNFNGPFGYWSSTEGGANFVWGRGSGGGETFPVFQTGTYTTRACRYF